MFERRKRRPADDNGARTRKTDRGRTPQAVHDWITTFNLRWLEHVERHPGPAEPSRA